MAGAIRKNLTRVRERIAAAAQRAGRAADEVTLVAVTKQRTPGEIRDLIRAGQRVFGENRAAEGLEKIILFGKEPVDPPLEWHFIGHLQTNKARKVVDEFSLFHGVDSLHVAEALQRAADLADSTVDILAEVNVSGETSKYGVSADKLGDLAIALRPLDRIRCIGLMTMAPLEADPEATRPVFRGLRKMIKRLGECGYEHLDLRHLSMGMTNDFEVAVEEGATMVRVGTALFAP